MGKHLTGRLAAARVARKRRPGLCALEGRFQQGFVQCRRRPVRKPPFEQGRQCTKPGSPAARPFRAWSCTETAAKPAGPCTEIGEKRARQGAVRPKNVHDLPAGPDVRNGLRIPRSWADPDVCAHPLGHTQSAEEPFCSNGSTPYVETLNKKRDPRCSIPRVGLATDCDHRQFGFCERKICNLMYTASVEVPLCTWHTYFEKNRIVKKFNVLHQ